MNDRFDVWRPWQRCAQRMQRPYIVKEDWDAKEYTGRQASSFQFVSFTEVAGRQMAGIREWVGGLPQASGYDRTVYSADAWSER